MIIARTLLQLGDVDRTLYLYDTFEGMPPPTDVDCSFDGRSAQAQLDATPPGEGIWARAGLDRRARQRPVHGLSAQPDPLHQGQVEDTIPATRPDKLALLRLDTDWYESTRHELIHLHPLLDPQGVLIIDDYGHYQGAKKAVDECFWGGRSFCTGLITPRGS